MGQYNKIAIIIFFTLSIQLLFGASGLCLPVKIRHLYHLLTAPKDLYTPIVYDHFNFSKKGTSKTYSLIPKYFDLYALSISFPNEKISSKHKFQGKLKIEFLYKKEVVLEKIADQNISALYADKEMSLYKRITLLNFIVPIDNKYKDNLSVRVSVIESDNFLEKYKDSNMLHIAVSSRP